MQRVTRWPTALLAAPIVCALTAAVAGCTKAVDGTALAAEPAIPATSTASPPPRAIPTTVLEGLLVSQDQLIAVVGGANMALVGTATSTSDSSKIVDDRTCLGLGSVGDVAIYANSGYVAIRGNQFSTPNAVRPTSPNSSRRLPPPATPRRCWRARDRTGNDAPSGGTGFTPRTAITATSSPTICAATGRASNCRCAKKKTPDGAARTRWPSRVPSSPRRGSACSTKTPTRRSTASWIRSSPRFRNKLGRWPVST